MTNTRMIARLDIKGPNLIKGVHLEGLRVVGDPIDFAHKYYTEGIDEIIFMDAVASLMGRNSLKSIIQKTASKMFIPLTVGGGIRSIEDVRQILRCGADKVAINTAAIARPELITEIAETFGTQCMVLQIDANLNGKGSWEAYTDGGREHSHMDVVQWASHGVNLGAGEVLLTSVDQEGTGKGLDLELIKEVSSKVTVPVIASGGVGKASDAPEAVLAGASAVAVAGALHYGRLTIDDIRSALSEAGMDVRDLNKETA